MKDLKKSMTMKDVAHLAGVGLGTVSRVVNGYNVKESTLKKVQDAIEELNYQPDEYARGLKTNRSNTIAIILPTIWHPFFSEFAYHVEKNLSKKNYKLFICNVESDASTEIEYIEMLKNNKVDGIIELAITVFIGLSGLGQWTVRYAAALTVMYLVRAALGDLLLADPTSDHESSSDLYEFH